MSEDPTTGVDPAEDPGDPKDPNEDPQQDPGPGEDPKKDDRDPELAKAIKARDTAKAKTRELTDKIRELEEKLNPGKADPVAAANRRLVSAEARVVLTGKGVTDAADQRALLDFLKLDGVPVSADGEVDADAIADQVETLLSIARKLNGGAGRKSPRVDTRDLGGEKGKPVDPARARRLEMLR